MAEDQDPIAVAIGHGADRRQVEIAAQQVHGHRGPWAELGGR